MSVRSRCRTAMMIIAAMGLVFMIPPAVGAGFTPDKEAKPLESWQALELRIHRDGKWRDYGFGTLEVHRLGILHRGKADTAIAW